MEDLKSKIGEIIKVVENFSEPYNQIAFKEILRRELSSFPENVKRNTTVELEEVPKGSQTFNEWEVELFDNLPKAYLVAENGSRDQQTVWAIIKLHSRSEEPNNDSIRQVIRDELGITPQNTSNTARTLRNLTPKYLSRQKEGKTYIYSPTRNSIRIFDGFN